jgi:hypothetical protein
MRHSFIERPAETSSEVAARISFVNDAAAGSEGTEDPKGTGGAKRS